MGKRPDVRKLSAPSIPLIAGFSCSPGSDSLLRESRLTAVFAKGADWDWGTGRLQAPSPIVLRSLEHELDAELHDPLGACA